MARNASPLSQLHSECVGSGLLPCILGPTAVGKTDLAIELARLIGAEIVSVDSRQIYEFMDIGTAKPTPEQRAIVPHHVIDCVDPAVRFSAYDFQQLADDAIRGIRDRGKLPMIVGGTGMYFRALVDGLFEGPEADEELRRELRSFADERGKEALFDMLQSFDPESASRIHPNDLVRVIRAIEVYLKTNTPLSQLQKQWQSGTPRYRFAAVVLRRDREELYARIDERTDRMIASGFVEEVAFLLERGYSRTLPSMRTLGYREIAAYLAGEISLTDAIEQTKKRTRQYARRQMIWFRGDKRLLPMDISDDTTIEDVAEHILQIVRKAR